ncbi:MAG: hypothetical protein V2I63_04040, partial [Pseudomonadales bacterium]|nr:hypothetical protein [Pseudomonadales bacterium]
ARAQHQAAEDGGGEGEAGGEPVQAADAIHGRSLAARGRCVDPDQGAAGADRGRIVGFQCVDRADWNDLWPITEERKER